MSDEARRPRVFRWQALLGRAAEAVFVLDRRRRLLFVNPAWEALTALSAEAVHGLPCRRPRPAAPGSAPEDVVAHLLTPPAEALAGGFARARRFFPAPPPLAPRWVDVEFLPLRHEEPGTGYFLLGRVLPLPAEERRPEAVLPERLADLRRRWQTSFTSELLASDVPAVRRLAGQVRLASRVDAPVLLVGEPGAGKQTVARIIHYQGPEGERPFAALDCRRLPAAVVADVLFGTTVGAVYLDEPARLPRDLQRRLCDGLAAHPPRKPRVLAGCARPTAQDVAAGLLLEDLACLLGVLTFEVPPLRQRLDDLPALVGRMGGWREAAGEGPPAALGPSAWEVLRQHAWPGNLAELRRVLADAQARAEGGRIDAAGLPAALRLRQAVGPATAAPKPAPLEATLAEVERRLIRLALLRSRGRRARAAELLGVYRGRLLRRMEALGMPEAKGQEEEKED
jgi:transcriptional regulator with PAS, ATPase and Fis domain